MRALRVVGMLVMLVLLGCSKEHPSGSVVLQFATRDPARAATDDPAVLFGDSAIVTLGGDTIVVRRGEIVVKQVALQPAATEECEPEEGEKCGVLEPGPALVDLPFEDGAEQLLNVRAAADAYSVFQVQIVTPDPGADGTFVAAHPEFANTSIRFRGTFSRSGARSDFVYVSDFSEIQELALVPPVRVPAGRTVRLTLRLDLARVFLSADRTVLVDPASANRSGPNEALVRDNVRRSLAAFRDEDGDGLDDGEVRPAGGGR
jgi:hypothetical protein